MSGPAADILGYSVSGAGVLLFAVALIWMFRAPPVPVTPFVPPSERKELVLRIRAMEAPAPEDLRRYRKVAEEERRNLRTITSGSGPALVSSGLLIVRWPTLWWFVLLIAVVGLVGAQLVYVGRNATRARLFLDRYPASSTGR